MSIPAIAMARDDTGGLLLGKEQLISRGCCE